MDLAQRLIVPLDNDLGCLGLVSFLHHHLHKFGLIQISIDHDLLTLLHMDAAADDELCVFS